MSTLRRVRKVIRRTRCAQRLRAGRWRKPAEREEKGPAARRRPRAGREAYFLYVERPAEGANAADGPLSSRSALSAAEAGIECVSERVAQQVRAEHREADRDAREENEPRRLLRVLGR